MCKVFYDEGLIRGPLAPVRHMGSLDYAHYSLQRIERNHFILIINPLNWNEKRVSNKEQCARCFTMKTFVGRFAPNKVLVFVRLCTIFITKNREEYISFSFQSSQLKWNKEWVIKNIVQCVIQLYTHSLNA